MIKNIISIITKVKSMKTKVYKYDGVTVTVIDHCEDENERRKRLEEAVRNFFIAVEEGKRKKANGTATK